MSKNRFRYKFKYLTHKLIDYDNDMFLWSKIIDNCNYDYELALATLYNKLQFVILAIEFNFDSNKDINFYIDIAKELEKEF